MKTEWAVKVSVGFCRSKGSLEFSIEVYFLNLNKNAYRFAHDVCPQK